MNPNLMSEYPESVLEIEEKYKISPMSGYLSNKYHPNDRYNAIDERKAYIHCLRSITDTSF